MKHLGSDTKIEDSINNGNVFWVGGITPGKIAKGIYDVCSVWRAVIETNKLQAWIS